MKIPSLSKPCPKEIANLSVIPTEDYIQKLRIYRNIKKDFESLDYNNKLDVTSLTERLILHSFVLGNLTSLIVRQEKMGKCEISASATFSITPATMSSTYNSSGVTTLKPPTSQSGINLQTRQPRIGYIAQPQDLDPQLYDYSCKLKICELSGFRGACHTAYDGSFPTLPDNNRFSLPKDSVASMNISSVNKDKPCLGYRLYMDPDFMGKHKDFKTGEYPGFRSLGPFFLETRAIHVIRA